MCAKTFCKMGTPETTQFGEVYLSWDDFHWVGSVYTPMFGSDNAGDVELEVNTKDELHLVPAEEQEQAWSTLLATKEQMFSSMLEAILAYYIRMRPQYAKAGPEWVAGMPKVSTVDEIRSMFELYAVTITYPYPERPIQIGLRCRCGWDSEHGLGVVFADGQVVDVGGADCAIL